MPSRLVSDMDAVLTADPGYREAYLERGKPHYLQQRHERAIDDFTAAIEHGIAATENGRECFYLRGMAQEVGDHLAAIADFTRIIDLTPDDGRAYLRRSWSYRSIGDSASADADFQVAAAYPSIAQEQATPGPRCRRTENRRNGTRRPAGGRGRFPTFSQRFRTRSPNG